MCGIAAILQPERLDAGDAIGRMTAALRHRGPDAHRTVQLPGCHLGHTRLSIIDLVGGHQPMTTPDRRYWIVFNGEIYNYRELRAELEQLGHAFQTRSDTEVLLRGYLQFGRDVVRRLNGQFAFLLWDSQERRLFGARDRLGEKPLYWAETPGGAWVFASEIKGLLASNTLRPVLDREAVDAYLALLYVPPRQTVYRNIATLPPGHACEWEDGRLTAWAYWQPRVAGGDPIDEADAVSELRRRISEAVRRQMVADVPVGAFLSGGLDSSTIVALMHTHTAHPVATFSVGFGDLINELPYARTVARVHATQHHEIQMDIAVGDLLERMAGVFDEPFADSSNLPTYLVAEFARRHVKVALSGDGADELFGGYDWYRLLFESPAEQPGAGAVAAAWLHCRALRLLGRLGLARNERVVTSAFHDARLRLRRRHPDVRDRHLAAVSLVDLDRRRYWHPGTPPDAAGALRQFFSNSKDIDPLDLATGFDVRCYLPGDILVKVDRAAMAHGLETRAPFLDVDLVEFALGLPARLRFHNQELKYLFRRTCQDLWPESLRHRRKQGFGAPIRHWLRRPDVQAHLRRVFGRNHPLRELLPGLPPTPPRHPQMAWNLLCLGLWLEPRTACLTPP